MPNQLAACPVCGSLVHAPVISHRTGLTTDLRTSSFPLEKIQCQVCGLVRSANTDFLASFYQESYRKAESDVITSVLNGDQAVAFSSLIEEWINTIAGPRLGPTRSVLEIGCGDGRLLNRLKGKRKVGLEPSRYLFELASKNCPSCHLENTGIESYDTKETFDVVLAVNVFEHLPDPKSFLIQTARLLNAEGVALLIYPTQEQFNYDVCFVDHLFHMRLGHLKYLAEEAGLTVLKQEVGYKSYQVANAVLLKKNTGQSQATGRRPDYLDNENPRLIIDIFRSFDEIISKFKGHKRIVAFGYGELSKVFNAYTQNFDCIEYFIDDFATSTDRRIMGFDRAQESGILQDALLVFLVNPYYRQHLGKRLQAASGLSHIYYPIEKELITL